MSKQLLTAAAQTAGITTEQAIAFLGAIAIPSTLMVQIGVEFSSMGTFYSPAEGYERLTPGEWNEAEACRFWIAMLSAMKLEPDIDLLAEPYTHFKEKNSELKAEVEAIDVNQAQF